MKIAIVFDSGFGHTQVIAENILQGVASTKLEAKLFPVKEINAEPSILEKLESYDAIIFEHQHTWVAFLRISKSLWIQPQHFGTNNNGRIKSPQVLQTPVAFLGINPTLLQHYLPLHANIQWYGFRKEFSQMVN